MPDHSAIDHTGLTGVGGGAFAAHGCRIKRASGNFSVGNNTLTAVQFDGTDDYDTDSMHDPSSSNTRIVIPSISGVTTGLWLFTAHGYGDPTTRWDSQFRKNAAGSGSGGTVLGGDILTGSGSVQGFNICVQCVLSATDYVELFVRSTGGTANVAYDANFSPIMAAAFLGKVT